LPARLIGDVRAVKKGKIVGAGLDALERLVGVITVKFDPSVVAEEGRADCAAEVEIEAPGLTPVSRLADETRTRNAAAADDAGKLDAIHDWARVGEGASGKGRERTEDRIAVEGAMARRRDLLPPDGGGREGGRARCIPLPESPGVSDRPNAGSP
jgi:hypothetical protein